MSADSFFLAITWLGSLYLLAPAAICLSMWMRTSGLSLGLLPFFSLITTSVAVHCLKLVFRRKRPESLELLVSMPGDWSFPSAHSAQAAAFFLAIALLASRTLSPLAASLCAFACLALTLAVGWSRVYLRVHYPSDVLAGFLLAVGIVTAIHFLFTSPHGQTG